MTAPTRAKPSRPPCAHRAKIKPHFWFENDMWYCAKLIDGTPKGSGLTPLWAWYSWADQMPEFAPPPRRRVPQ